MSEQRNREVWIGLAELRALPDSAVLAEVTGAYVNILMCASDAAEFRSKTQELADYLRLIPESVENPEPLSNRGDIEELDPELAEIARELQDEPNAVRYGTFHTWTHRSA